MTQDSVILRVEIPELGVMKCIRVGRDDPLKTVMHLVQKKCNLDAEFMRECTLYKPYASTTESHNNSTDDGGIGLMLDHNLSLNQYPQFSWLDNDAIQLVKFDHSLLKQEGSGKKSNNNNTNNYHNNSSSNQALVKAAGEKSKTLRKLRRADQQNLQKQFTTLSMHSGDVNSAADGKISHQTSSAMAQNDQSPSLLTVQQQQTSSSSSGAYKQQLSDCASDITLLSSHKSSPSLYSVSKDNNNQQIQSELQASNYSTTSSASITVGQFFQETKKMSSSTMKKLTKIVSHGHSKGSSKSAHGKDSSPQSSINSTFGIPLYAVPKVPGTQIPVIIKVLLRHLKKYDLQTEGIFRLSGAQSTVLKLKNLFDNDPDGGMKFLAVGEDALLDYINLGDGHAVAGVVKLFLRELPDPLLTFALFDAFIACAQSQQSADQMNSGAQRLWQMYVLVNGLPSENRDLLCTLLQFSSLVSAESNSSHNKMSLQNMATVLAPNILRCELAEETSAQQMVMNAAYINAVVLDMIKHVDMLFMSVSDMCSKFFQSGDSGLWWASQSQIGSIQYKVVGIAKSIYAYQSASDVVDSQGLQELSFGVNQFFIIYARADSSFDFHKEGWWTCGQIGGSSGQAQVGMHGLVPSNFLEVICSDIELVLDINNQRTFQQGKSKLQESSYYDECEQLQKKNMKLMDENSKLVKQNEKLSAMVQKLESELNRLKENLRYSVGSNINNDINNSLNDKRLSLRSGDKTPPSSPIAQGSTSLQSPTLTVDVYSESSRHSVVNNQNNRFSMISTSNGAHTPTSRRPAPPVPDYPPLRREMPGNGVLDEMLKKRILEKHDEQKRRSRLLMMDGHGPQSPQLSSSTLAINVEQQASQQTETNYNVNDRVTRPGRSKESLSNGATTPQASSSSSQSASAAALRMSIRPAPPSDFIGLPNAQQQNLPFISTTLVGTIDNNEDDQSQVEKILSSPVDLPPPLI
ncbi:hypothetical protein MP228_003200 [Amoeboaphelidium protococcarum]|nr:hypothetical protein MP228_003200 [Amoeboaphelidium protococcarum]